jgi:APA family basic amino acid/polyamine antiporter
VPVPSLIGLALTTLGLVSIALLHGGALIVGGGWRVFGHVAYFIYRRGVEGISLTDRVTVPEQALQKQIPDVELASVLVPVFGLGIDDEIVSTAGRLADSDPLPGQRKPRLELLYVIKLPLTVPLDAPPPADRVAVAEKALARAMEIAAEYPGVEAESGWVGARSIGEAVVDQAREREVEAIIIGGEPPTRIRGGAVLGGVRGAKPAEIGPVTEYVLRNAPCRVLLTAPPEPELEPIEPVPQPLTGQ